ncbi:MAG TPA: hypothetical protein PKC21_06195 [Oligoflexia bacterium]|nr:hypothetical protein [Oligoflexia bacterium]HMR24925.1 hypothetical protein [Oligoflexia bacterium]
MSALLFVSNYLEPWKMAYDTVLFPIILMNLLLIIIGYRKSGYVDHKIFSCLVFFVVFSIMQVMFCSGWISFFNAVLPVKDQVYFKSGQVVSMHTETGSRGFSKINMHFYFTVKDGDNIAKIKVSRNEYEHTRLKDTYPIAMKKGFFGIFYKSYFF